MIQLHFLFALFLGLARCGNNIVEELTCDVGESVSLRCPRNLSETNTFLNWIRLLPGHLLEFLGGTPSYDDTTPYESPDSSAETKQEPGSFVLSLKQTELRDTGFYYCVKVHTLQRSMIFVRATFLKIKGPDSAVSVESPELSGTVISGDSMDLQCWVQTENAQCSKEHMLLWFRSGMDQSSPGLVYTQKNSSGQCNSSTEDHGPHKCFYTFSKTMSRSDAGTYRCAVAACGHILFGNRVQVQLKAEEKCILEKNIIILLSVLLSISLIVIILVICSIKRKCGPCFFDGKTNLRECKRLQREVIYSAPQIKKKKSKPQCRAVNSEEHVVYSDVRS